MGVSTPQHRKHKKARPIDTTSLRERALTPLEPGDPPRFPPKEAFIPTDADGSPLCPLCQGPNPDSHHYLSHNCPNVLEESGLLRRSAASLIESLNAFTEHACPTIPALHQWLRSLVPNLGFATTKNIPQDGSSQYINGCRLKAWPEDGINLPSTGPHFGVFPSDLLSDGESHSGRPCPFRFKYLLHIPRKRAIGRSATGTSKDSYEKPQTVKVGLSLVAIGDSTLPSIDIDDVERLGATLRGSMIWGPHKLSLRWNGTSWPLDSLIEDPQPILNEAGILPLDSAPLARPAPGEALEALLGLSSEDTGPGAAEVAAASYLGLLPGKFPGKVGTNLLILPPKVRKKFRAELLHCITAGQHQLWCAMQSAIAQVLRHERRSCIAKAKGRPRPPRRPYFVVLRTHKARFPPSTHLQNLARLWHKKEGRDPWGSEKLLEEFLRFCTRKNVTEVDRPTLHLAILTLLNEVRPTPIHQQPAPRAPTSPSPPIVGLPGLTPPSPPPPACMNPQPANLGRHGQRFLKKRRKPKRDRTPRQPPPSDPASPSNPTTEEDEDDPPQRCVSCRSILGSFATIRYHTVSLQLPSGYVYPAINCETCGPLDGTHPEADIIGCNAPAPVPPQTGEVVRDGAPPPTPDTVPFRPLVLPHPLKTSDFESLRPRAILSPALLHFLSNRIRRDALRDYSDRVDLCHLLPPLLLPPLPEEQKDREGSHRKLPFPPIHCDPQSGVTLLLPLMVKGHWMLILISPRRSRGLITILSSRRRYGISEVKLALRATFDSEDTPLRCADGPPIVTWDIQYPYSTKESPRSCDGGVFVLVHIASILSNIPLADPFDASSVRVFLASLVVPPDPLEEVNFFGPDPPAEGSFFGPGTAPVTQPPAVSATWG